MKSGNIPVLNIQGDTVPRAYERAIKEVWEKGRAFAPSTIARTTHRAAMRR